MFTDYLDGWTADDTRKLDVAFAKMANSEPLETDEVKLVSKWEIAQALEDEAYKAKLKIMQDKAEQDLKQSQESHDASMKLLNLQVEAAQKRLEMVTNGQA